MSDEIKRFEQIKHYLEQLEQIRAVQILLKYYCGDKIITEEVYAKTSITLNECENYILDKIINLSKGEK